MSGMPFGSVNDRAMLNLIKEQRNDRINNVSLPNNDFLADVDPYLHINKMIYISNANILMNINLIIHLRIKNEISQ